MYVKFIFLASNFLSKCMTEFNTNETGRYTLVLSSDKKQVTIKPFFIFHSLCSLLVTFPLIFPCPFPAQKLPNKPICIRGLRSTNFWTQEHCPISEGPSFPHFVFNKLDLVKGNAINTFSRCLLCLITLMF